MWTSITVWTVNKCYYHAADDLQRLFCIKNIFHWTKIILELTDVTLCPLLLVDVQFQWMYFVDVLLLDEVDFEVDGYVWAMSQSVIYLNLTVVNMHQHTIHPPSPGYYAYYVQVPVNIPYTHKSPAYEPTVDLWSNTNAMEIPSTYSPLLVPKFFKYEILK